MRIIAIVIGLLSSCLLWAASPAVDQSFGWTDVARTDQHQFLSGCEYRIVVQGTVYPSILYSSARENDKVLFFLTTSIHGTHFKYLRVLYTDKKNAYAVTVRDGGGDTVTVDINQIQKRCGVMPTAIINLFNTPTCPSGWKPLNTKRSLNGYIYCEKL